VIAAAARELALRLCATTERRAAERARIAQLANGMDQEWLASAFAAARMLPLLGSRLVAAAPDAVSPAFVDAVDGALLHGRRRAMLTEQLALRLARGLEDEGIPVVVLKGPQLAERLYGDVGLRASNDVDLLVAPEDFHAAAHALEPHGYRCRKKAPWIGDLPLFEMSLEPLDDWRPPIDLHWRLHWYETEFSRAFAGRCVRGPGGLRVPRPDDELAALLLFWCRDGLAGLRHAADAGAWWDRHGAALDRPALDAVAAAHPPLRRPLAAATALAGRTAGVPAARLLSGSQRGVRVRLALRLANPVVPTSGRQAQAGVVAIDGLLTPRGNVHEFVRRHVVLPAAVISEIYDLPPGARVRRLGARGFYAARRIVRLAAGVAGLMARVSGRPRPTGAGAARAAPTRPATPRRAPAA
jgi:hypothetical protein